MSRKFVKHGAKKSRLDLVPPIALNLVGHVLSHGASEKYTPRNWEACKDPDIFVAAGLRHLYQHLSGSPLDRDSKFPHLANAACSVLFALELWMKADHTIKVRDPKVRQEFHYFAAVKPLGKKRGEVLSRHKTYEKCWNWIHDNAPDDCIVLTVLPAVKVGTVVRI